MGAVTNQVLVEYSAHLDENAARADRTLELIASALVVIDHFSNNPSDIDPRAQSFPPDVDALRTSLESPPLGIDAAEPCLVLLINGIAAYSVGAMGPVTGADGIERPAAESLREQARLLRRHVVAWREHHSGWLPTGSAGEAEAYFEECRNFF